MKIHYKNGCPWADGNLYANGGFDTEQITEWSKVTCQHCLKHRPTLTPQERNNVVKKLIKYASQRRKLIPQEK